MATVLELTPRHKSALVCGYWNASNSEYEWDASKDVTFTSTIEDIMSSPECSSLFSIESECNEDQRDIEW